MITSRANDKVKYIEKLRQKASFRREEGLFITEGIRMVREVPPELRQELFLTEKALLEHPELQDWCDSVETVSPEVMDKLSDTRTPQGMVATVRIPGESSILIEKTGSEGGNGGNNGSSGVYFILCGLQDPGNCGTIVRTAEAVGADGVILSEDSADPFSPKVVRSTMGAIFRVPVRVVKDIPGLLKEFKNRGTPVYGTHLAGKDLYRADLSGPGAFLIGSEGKGLSEEIAGEADHLLRIPMEGRVESLNAAISAAVVGYEALRQRMAAGGPDKA